MLRAGEVVAIVGASLVLTGGVMWTRGVAAWPETVREVPPSEPAAQKPVRAVHPGYLRRPAEEAGPQRWVDPYRIRRLVERQPAP